MASLGSVKVAMLTASRPICQYRSILAWRTIRKV